MVINGIVFIMHSPTSVAIIKLAQHITVTLLVHVQILLGELPTNLGQTCKILGGKKGRVKGMVPITSCSSVLQAGNETYNEGTKAIFQSD